MRVKILFKIKLYISFFSIYFKAYDMKNKTREFLNKKFLDFIALDNIEKENSKKRKSE